MIFMEGDVSGGGGGMFRSSGGLKSRGHFHAINKDPDLLPHQPHPEDPKWEKTKETLFSNWFAGAAATHCALFSIAKSTGFTLSALTAGQNRNTNQSGPRVFENIRF